MKYENQAQRSAESTACGDKIHGEDTAISNSARTDENVERPERLTSRAPTSEVSRFCTKRSLSDGVSEVTRFSNSAQHHVPIVGSLVALSDERLTSELEDIAVEKRVVDARLLLYLSELDRRRLYRERGFPSLFEFCVSHLGFSEDVAYKRVSAARTIREYPLALELLCAGKIHLSALVILKPHLNPGNYREWLAIAVGKTKREIERLVVGRFPQPDTASRIRKLPEVVTCDEPMRVTSTNNLVSKDSEGGASFVAKNAAAIPSAPIGSPSSKPSGFASSQSVTNRVDATRPVHPPIPSRRTVVQPISAHKYRVTFTTSAEFIRKLEHAKALVSHSISPVDLTALFERALDMLIESTERRRFGSTRSRRVDRPLDSVSPVQIDERGSDAAEMQSASEPTGEVAPATQCSRRIVADEKPARHGAGQDETEPRNPSMHGPHQSRYVPANVRRVVWQRDEGQCTFVSDEGRRCSSQHFLQIDHVTPFAFGGVASATNLRLRCASHNTMHAEHCFGHERIATAVARARSCRHE